MASIQQFIGAGKRLVASPTSVLALAGAVVTVAAGQAHGVISAPLTLTLSEPGSAYAPITLTDTGNTGDISFVGTYGDFTTNFIIGLSNKLLGPTPLGQLQVQSLNVTSNTALAKTLSIVVSDIGYVPTAVGPNLMLSSSLAGTLTSSVAGDTVTFQSSVVPSTGTIVTGGQQTFTSTTSNPISTVSLTVPTVQAVFPTPGSYGVIEQITATLSNANETANISGSATVGPVPVSIPEPAGMAILSTAGIALLGRSRRLA